MDTNNCMTLTTTVANDSYIPNTWPVPYTTWPSWPTYYPHICYQRELTTRELMEELKRRLQAEKQDKKLAKELIDELRRL